MNNPSLPIRRSAGIASSGGVDAVRSAQLSARCRRVSFRLHALALGLGFGLIPAAHAASDTWDNGAGDNLWQSVTNWAADSAFPGATSGYASTDDATFGATAAGGAIQLGGTINVRSLLFGVAGADAAAFTIGGASDVLNFTSAGGITINSGVTTAQTIGVSGTTLNLSTDASATTTFTNNGTGLLTIAGNLVANTASGTAGLLTVGGTGSTTVTGSVTEPGVGTQSLLKTGAGTLTLSNGSAWSGAGAVGRIPTPSASFPVVAREGTLLLAGGTHTVTGELVIGGVVADGGAGQNAKLQVDTGTLNISSWLSIGRGNGAGGVNSDLELNNGAIVTAGNLSAGSDGGNAANLPKGTITLNGTSSLSVNAGDTSFFIAESAGSNFTLTLNNSSGVTINGSATGSDSARQRSIGHRGTGTLNINDSASFNDVGTSVLNVGYQNGTGVVNVNSGTFSHANGDVRVGGSDQNGIHTGSGTMNINGGTATVGSLTLARGNSNTSLINGTVNLTSGTLTVVNDVTVGFAGNGNVGQLNINGGTLNVGTTVTKWMRVGNWDTTRGEVNITSGALNLNSNTEIKMNADGTIGANVITQSGGTVTFYSDNATTVGGTGHLDMQRAGAAASNNTYHLNGGALTVPQVLSTAVTGTRTFNFNGGTLRPTGSTTTFFNLGTGNARANVRNGGALIDSNGFSVTIAQPLLHSNIGGDNATDGGLTKSGLGTLTLSGANTFIGDTTVNAGGLTIGSTGSLLFAVSDSDSTRVLGTGAFVFDGAMKLDLSAVTVTNASWQLVDTGTLATSFGGTFAVQDNSGLLTFTKTGPIWTSNDTFWSFSETNGTLSVVPEPAAYAVLAGVLGLGFAAFRRRRHG